MRSQHSYLRSQVSTQVSTVSLESLNVSSWQETIDDKPGQVLLHNGGHVQGEHPGQDGLQLLVTCVQGQGKPVNQSEVSI